jgi:alpha-glucosidase
VGLRDPADSHIAMGAWDGDLDLWLIPGPTLRDVVRGMARLTGVHELPPVWALGYHQCRWGYKSAAELKHVSDRLEEYRIPTGAIWMDIDYMKGYRIFTFDPQGFPDPAKTNAFLHRHGFSSYFVAVETTPIGHGKNPKRQHPTGFVRSN